MTTRVRVPGSVSTGDVAALAEDAAHHLTHVLRLGVGSPVLVVDDSTTLFESVITDAQPLSLRIGAKVPEGALANPTHSLTLWLPLLKGGKADDLVRQLTELGVSDIVPWLGLRSVVRLDPAKALKRQQRWQKIADEATRQCRRTDRVTVHALARGAPRKGPGVFLYEDGTTPLQQALADAPGPHPRSLTLLVGPEGGLAPEEVRGMAQAGWSAAWLGHRILRAETAVIVAAVAGLQSLGEL